MTALGGLCRKLAGCALLACFSSAAQAPGDLRMALVIGNSAYAAAPLANPANDARAMSEALRAMGFVVVETRNASREQMKAGIAEMVAVLKGRNGIGMLYYAGHGMQLDWRNYMVPVDASLRSPADISAQTIDVQSVLDAFKAAGNRMNIVVLDACRDNPFGAMSGGKGLAQMDAPPGTLLAYATAPGNVAEDGTAASGNGLYTGQLVEALKQPNTKIEDIFKRVRWQVRKQSQGRQVPWESTSLEDDFYFDPKIKVVRLDEAERARAAVGELSVQQAEWSRVKDSGSADAIYSFLERYPSGLLSEQAQFRLDQLQKSAVQPQPSANGVRPLPSGTDRYAVGDEFVYDQIDGYSHVATRRLTMRVTSVANGRVEINGGEEIYDQMGAQIKTMYGTKEPGVLAAPAELSVGKHWRSAYLNTPSSGSPVHAYYDFKVASFEEVVVPAGRFMAFRIERSGEGSAPGNYFQQSGAMWIDPVTMHPVRTDVLTRRGGKIELYYSQVMVSSKLAPRAR